MVCSAPGPQQEKDSKIGHQHWGGASPADVRLTLPSGENPWVRLQFALSLGWTGAGLRQSLCVCWGRGREAGFSGEDPGNATVWKPGNPGSSA